MKITILGIGNILYGDEGFGVRVVEELKNIGLPEDVELIDGGTDGAKLLPVIMQADYLIIIDAIRADDEAGAIFRIPIEELRQRQGLPIIKTSLHQMSIMDVLSMANVLDRQVRGVIIGIQPKEIPLHPSLPHEGGGWRRGNLSPEIEARVPEVIDLIMKEVHSHA
jgi:hydrogenase maturation protease